MTDALPAPPTPAAGAAALAALVGESPAMVALRAAVARLAPLAAPVLIAGETGVGKELVARALAALRGPPGAPFVAVNCGTLTGELAADALFGHERGAFTGACERRAGALEQAHGGTLFLDELGELPLRAQAQLLRALDGGEVRRLGGQMTLRLSPRVVTATHRCLPAQVRRGRFRADLYFRVAVLLIEVPPLRHRLTDLAALTTALLTAEGPAPGGGPFRLAPGALAHLATHAWPGNVRELRHVLQRATALADGPELRPRDLAIGDAALVSLHPRPPPSDLAALEARAIRRALRQHGGSRVAAAASLGISRATLHRRLARGLVPRAAPVGPSPTNGLPSA